MSAYVTEEEQLEMIRKWWKENGNIVLTSIAVVLLLLAGWRWWNYQHLKMQTNASTMYEMMLASEFNHNEPAVEATANDLVTRYPRTPYADVANMMLAKVAVSKNDYAKAEQSLQTVVNKSTDSNLSIVARLRLARIQLTQKKYQDALAVLAPINNNSFMSAASELKGDIYLAMNKTHDAKASYQQAMRFQKESNSNNVLLEMKLDSLA